MAQAIAPRLRALVDLVVETTERDIKARAELRALLAVAGAAKWDHRTQYGECPLKVAVGMRSEPCRVCRALDRLDKVSL